MTSASPLEGLHQVVADAANDFMARFDDAGPDLAAKLAFWLGGFHVDVLKAAGAAVAAATAAERERWNCALADPSFCLWPCDPDCEVGPFHCRWEHEPNHKPGWHSLENCPFAALFGGDR